MKPSMKDDVKILVPKTDDEGRVIENDYGQCEYEVVSSKARVLLEEKTHIKKNGEVYISKMEVCLPSNSIIGNGYLIIYEDEYGNEYKGKVESIEEARNFAGNKILFRCVRVV